MEEENLPNFSGKIVALYLANASRGIQDGIVLEYAEFKSMGGRLFLIGRSPEIEGMEWVSHLQGAVAWDSVQHYLIFDSVDDYRQRMAKDKPGFMSKVFGRGEHA
jgi:hypothetical protein